MTTSDPVLLDVVAARCSARRALTGRGPGARTSAGALLALLAFGVYSTHDVVVKTLGGTYSPLQIVFFANLFGFPS